MAKKKRDEAEIEAVERELPLQPPAEIVNAIKGVMDGAKLVYRSDYVIDPLTGLKEKACRVTCTACGRSFFLGYSPFYIGCQVQYAPAPFAFVDPSDNEPKYTGKACTCPECGAQAEALHIGNITRGTYFIERAYFMTIHNVRGHFAALGWVIFKECDKDGKVYFDVKRYEGVVTIGGIPVRYCGYGTFMFGTTWRNYWEARQRWRDNLDEWDDDEIFFVDPIEGTDADKSAFERYAHDAKEKIRVGAYIQLWSKYPQIENLVRSGLALYVADIISRSTEQNGYSPRSRYFSIKEAPQFFDRKKVKPHEMLGLEKYELPLAKKHGISAIAFYKRTKAERGIKLTPEQLDGAEKIGMEEYESLISKAKEKGIKLAFVRTLNYIIKQRSKHGSLIGLNYYRDYLKMTAEIIQESLPEDLVYPKNLKTAHDNAVDRYRQHKDEIINKKILNRAAELSSLRFEDEETGLMIRPAESQDELTREGKELHHCVATYAKSVAEGLTSILFIRRIDEPDVPFFTLEWKNGAVQQNRGSRNCSRTPEVTAFEKKWLKYVKEKNHGKRTGTQKEQRAGA